MCLRTGIQKLKEKGNSEPFLKSCYLSFYSLPTTRKIHVDLNEAVCEYILTLHLERFTGIGTVESVKFSSPLTAVVTFKDSKGSSMALELAEA
jgi:hypothetical protein